MDVILATRDFERVPQMNGFYENRPVAMHFTFRPTQEEIEKIVAGYVLVLRLPQNGDPLDLSVSADMRESRCWDQAIPQLQAEITSGGED